MTWNTIIYMSPDTYAAIQRVIAEIEAALRGKVESDLHKGARRLVRYAQANGAEFDRKQLRYNEIVQTALGYADLGEKFSPRVAGLGLREVVESANKDSDLYIKGSKASDWLAPYATGDA